MAHGHHADPSQPGHSGGAAAYAPSAPGEANRTSGPCHCGEPEVPSTCCDTECFERPRYFCGHLLTDADLTLEQRYVIGKQKLYHRALHGHGIVCGLRLTCDPSCSGHVTVGEGFAIDDCGNDLVVCEPASFDVVAALRDKKLLHATPAADDCEPGTWTSDCPTRDCFYIVACYAEEEQEFATPLTPPCGPSPRDCEPTRIRETVRFDVLDKLPRAKDPLADLEHRIEHCFTLFMDGPFAEAVKEARTQDALSGSASPEYHEDYCNQIRKLRILFKRYLECHPDHYNCTLVKDLDAIACPPKPHDYKQTDPTQHPANGYPSRNDGSYGTDMRDAVCRIVDLAYSHVMGCVMGELAFSCPEPAHASCIVLGTVEIENERVAKVCNCPRSYVWSFASFWQVLMATLFGSLACKATQRAGVHKDHDDPSYEDNTPEGDGDVVKHRDEDRDCGCDKTLGRHPCCRELTPEDGCENFVKSLQDGGEVASDVATALLDALKWIRCSVQHAYAPTRTDALLLRAMRGKPAADVLADFRKRGVHIVDREAPANRVPFSLLDALDASAHVSLSDPLVAETRAGYVVDIRKQPVLDRVATTEVTVNDFKKGLGSLMSRMDKLQKEVLELKARIAGQDGPSPSSTEPGEPAAPSTARRSRKNGRKEGPA